MNDVKFTLYEMQKQQLGYEHPIDPINYNKIADAMARDLSQYKYAMLFNRERADYTIFRFSKDTEKDFSVIAKDIQECLNNRGIVLRIDLSDDETAWKIWIRDFETDDNFLYYFFDYSRAVLEY